MSIKSDNWIIEQSKKHELITPFLEEQVREASGNKIISYGVSSYGYDVRCANEFKIFTNTYSSIVDPKSFDPKGFNFKKHFQDTNVTQAHARKLKTFYENALDDFKELDRYPTAGQLKKMDDHTQDMWEQLKEGYGHFKKSDIKTYTIAIENLMSALDFVIDSAKINRKPRKAKPKSATKLVEKLKYCKTYDKYKIASILPDQIIKSNELWVFNTKTRKIGKYVARNIDPQGQQRDGTGLSVKGTTIIGFDEEKSIQKTLRKPEEQLKDFKAAGKVKLRTFLEDIKTLDTKLNGRCNPDTLLLKVN